MSSDEGETDEGARRVAFLRDLAELPATALRAKYPREEMSHRAMLRRSKDGAFLVDPRWLKFARFLQEMGPVPEPGWTLDRIDSNRREYGPDLCRWADKQTQSENRANTKWVTFEGRSVTAAEFARLAGKPASTVYSAFAAGRTSADILHGRRPSGYLPGRFTGGEIDDWLRRYDVWLKRVPRPKRPEAPPEVFDIIEISKQFRICRAWLDERDFDSLNDPSDAEDRARIEATPHFAVVSSTDAWLADAFASLDHRNPSLGGRVRRGRHKSSYSDWESYLMRPLPE